MFSSVAADEAERRAARPGDDIVARPDVVMDRAFTVAAPPAAVWPWLVQLGKKRAGWYLPGSAERFLPRARRAARGINPAWQQSRVGEVIPDYGGRDATFEVAAIEPGSFLVYRSVRGQMNVTWCITLLPVPVSSAPPAGRPAEERTRVHMRLRLAPVRRKWLAETAGEFIDALTIAEMAAGLKERLAARTSAVSVHGPETRALPAGGISFRPEARVTGALCGATVQVATARSGAWASDTNGTLVSLGQHQCSIGAVTAAGAGADSDAGAGAGDSRCGSCIRGGR